LADSRQILSRLRHLAAPLRWAADVQLSGPLPMLTHLAARKEQHDPMAPALYALLVGFAFTLLRGKPESGCEYVTSAGHVPVGEQ